MPNSSRVRSTATTSLMPTERSAASSQATSASRLSPSNAGTAAKSRTASPPDPPPARAASWPIPWRVIPSCGIVAGAGDETQPALGGLGERAQQRDAPVGMASHALGVVRRDDRGLAPFGYRQMKAGIPMSEVMSQIAADMPARSSRSSASPQPGSSTVRGSIRRDAASSGARTRATWPRRVPPSRRSRG